jgi:hypothetical protein
VGRLPRFPHNRFLGVKLDWLVYDCDDAEQFADLEAREEQEHLVARNLISAVAPDTLAEARNRGFRPATSS